MTEDAARTANGKGVVLSPDPTILTRDAIVRDLTALREILDAQIAGNLAVLTARLDGNEKAVILLQTAHDKLPTQMDAKIQQLKDLHGERFRNVDQRFEERDVRTQQAAERDKVSIDAALAAQEKQANERSETIKEATDKSEAATMKLIDAQTARISDATGGLERQHGDLKERVTRFEAAELSRTTTIADIRAAAVDQRALQERVARVELQSAGVVAAQTEARALQERVTRVEAGDVARAATIAELRANAVDLRALQERLARIESLAVGQATAQTNQRAGAGETRAYAALGISVLVAVIALMGLAVSMGMR